MCEVAQRMSTVMLLQSCCIGDEQSFTNTLLLRMLLIAFPVEGSQQN